MLAPFGAQNRPYEESLELNRLVLLDDVPANAETWAQARVFRLAAARGVRRVVAHSDPELRISVTGGTTCRC
ncbi:hypothetical protein ACFVRU_01905 [Streptomyces sp. NPDC057927]